MRSQPPSLNASLRGIIWMLFSSAFYALIYVVIRALSESFPANQLVLFRALLGSAMMLPWVFMAGPGALRTRHMPLYLWRMAFSYAGAVAWMYGIAFIPLADAGALMFTMPLFTVVFAAVWLAERVDVHRWTATAAGFAGTLVILRPGLIEVSLPALATVVAAASFSAALIGTKKLTATENPNAMVFYLYALMIPPAALGAVWGWNDPGIEDLPLLLALGACTVGAQQCQTRAFRVAPASLAIIVTYVQMPMIALLGWLVFGQTTDVWTWLGATMICTSTCYIGLRSNRSGSAKK